MDAGPINLRPGLISTFALLGLLAGYLWGARVAYAGPRNDTQYWSELDVTEHFTPTISATFFGTGRIGDGLPNPTLGGGGVQIDNANGPWVFSVGALFVRIRNPATGTATNVQLPLAAVTYTLTISGINISDRNRIEQIESIPGSPSRYRNRLLLDYPVKSAGPISHVFLSDEAFYSIKDFRWARNRAQAGLGLPLGAAVEIQLFYLRQSDRFSRIRAMDVIGTTFKISMY